MYVPCDCVTHLLNWFFSCTNFCFNECYSPWEMFNHVITIELEKPNASICFCVINGSLVAKTQTDPKRPSQVCPKTDWQKNVCLSICLFRSIQQAYYNKKRAVNSSIFTSNYCFIDSFVDSVFHWLASRRTLNWERWL